jgi:hypothetical protein
MYQFRTEMEGQNGYGMWKMIRMWRMKWDGGWGEDGCVGWAPQDGEHTG